MYRSATIRSVVAHVVTFRILLGYLFLYRIRKWIGDPAFNRRIKKMHLRNARRLRSMILRMNGLFIKIGQLLASMGKLLPEEYIDVLEDLQDRAPQSSIGSVRKQITESLGKSPEQLFTQFEDQASASASIAQVHKAQLRSGKWVAVKVKHAHIDRIAAVDLRIVKQLTRIGSWIFRIEGMDFIYSQIALMIRQELDFGHERTAQQRMNGQLKKHHDIIVPEAFPQYCSGSVLTTSWHHGVKVSNTAQLDQWGIDKTAVARRIVGIYCDMLFEDGFYHADPHPGNLLVNEQGQIILLDFGAVGTLDDKLRSGIPLMVEAVFIDDAQLLINTGAEIGFLAEGVRAEKTALRLYEAVRKFIMDELKMTDLNFRNIEIDPMDNSIVTFLKGMSFREMSATFRIPQDWILLNRALTLIVGLCATLDASFNPLEVVRPYLRRQILKQDKRSFLRIAWSLARTRLCTVQKNLETGNGILARIRRTAAAAIGTGVVVVDRLLQL